MRLSEPEARALSSVPAQLPTLHGSSGARVSSYTLSAYRRAVRVLLNDWQSETLLRPSRNAGVLWVRDLEARKPVKGKNDTM